MRIRTILLTTLIIGGGFVQAQDCSTGRYAGAVFSGSVKTADVMFGENDQPTQQEPDATQVLYMDIYQPEGDTASERPLLIFAFGGGFILGSKTSPDIVTLCQRFAAMGYVTASIDYRLTQELAIIGSEKMATMAVLKGMHDMRAAIRFFRQDASGANTYKVDPKQIYVGGVSAGAIVALQTAYMDKESEIPSVLFNDTAGLGGIEGLSGNPGFSSGVAGVISLSGGVGDTNIIEPGDIPVVSVHGDQDDVVPYGSDLLTLYGINMDFHGGLSVHNRATHLAINNALYTFWGTQHTPFIFETNAAAYMDTTIDFVMAFMQPLVCPSPPAGMAQWEQLQLMAYPNPASDEVLVQLPHAGQHWHLEVFDRLGRKVAGQLQMQGPQCRINTTGWVDGLYFITAKHPNTGDQLHLPITIHHTQ